MIVVARTARTPRCSSSVRQGRWSVVGEVQLTGVLSEFARTMVTDFPIQAILDRLVERIVEVLPITAAGVTLISSSAQPRYVAASNGAALQFEKLQTELGEGPCLEAYYSGKVVSVSDLAAEDRFAGFVTRALQEGLAAVFTFPLRHGEGQLGALDLYRDTAGPLDESTMVAAQTLADVAAAYLLNAQVRSDLFESHARFRDSALHDGLTGLPNRVLFLERLEHALSRGKRSGKVVAVLFADLDRFKTINDLHGHRTGDEVLVAVARRLAALIRPGDTVGRLSGDEFVIICEDLENAAEAVTIAARVHAELALPLLVSGRELSVTASVGIAFSGRDDHIPEQILHRADIAMYRAKRHGGGRQEVFDLREHHPAKRQVALSYDLGGALAREEFRLAYQPIVATSTGRVVSVEGLLRWAHPNRGSVAPAMFIPLAERSGLMADIGRWVVEQALADSVKWAGIPARFGLSLNVSVPELMSPGFAADIAALLAAAGADPATITLEVTESAFIQDGQRAMMVLSDLKKIGVSLALDDFGTGYSSLSHLQRFPIDVVKIDRSFVADLATNPSSHSIVEALIELSRKMGMTITAEGIETQEQHSELASLGCDNCQGSHFARPVAADKLAGLIGLDGDVECCCTGRPLSPVRPHG
jgi:diguanylate cyclase (GGDEF)-like protein